MKNFIKKNVIIQKNQNKETKNAATATKLILQEKGLKVIFRRIQNILRKSNLKVDHDLYIITLSRSRSKISPIHHQRKRSWALNHCGMGVPDWDKIVSSMKSRF